MSARRILVGLTLAADCVSAASFLGISAAVMASGFDGSSDTVTTGLDPAGGDEVIQIGATRVVAGKLRRESVLEQLVDPQRSVPEADIAIHGIQPGQLAGQPTIAAEVFVKMLPLLRERGLVTLGQVLEASRATWLARVRY